MNTIKVQERVSDDTYQKLYQKGYRAGKREQRELTDYKVELLDARYIGAKAAVDYIKADNLTLLIRARHFSRVLRERMLMGVLLGELLVIAAYLTGSAV